MMLSCKPIPIRPLTITPSVEEKPSTEVSSMVEEVETEEETLTIEQEFLRLEEDKQAFEELRANWLEEVTQLRENAHQQGFEAGYTEGLAQGTTDGYNKGFEQVNQELRVCVEQVKKENQRVKQALRQQLIDVQPFLLEIIEKSVESIIYEQLEQGENRHMFMIEKALSYVSKHRFITLHVSQQQYDWVKSQQHELETTCPQAMFQILPNPTLEAYDVVVETEQTELDFRINLQLEHWKEDIRRVVEITCAE